VSGNVAGISLLLELILIRGAVAINISLLNGAKAGRPCDEQHSRGNIEC
jgi:hypothetical protein